MSRRFSNLQQQKRGAFRLLPGVSTPIQAALRAGPSRKQDDREIFGEVEGADKEPPYIDPTLDSNFNMPDPMTMPGSFTSDPSPPLPMYPDIRSRNLKAVPPRPMPLTWEERLRRVKFWAILILKIDACLFTIALIMSSIVYPAAKSHFDLRKRADWLPPEPYPFYSFPEGPVWTTSSNTIYSTHDNIEISTTATVNSKPSGKIKKIKTTHPKQSISPLLPPNTPLQRGPFYDNIKEPLEYEPHDPSSKRSSHYIQHTLDHLFHMIPFTYVRPGSNTLQLSQLAKDLDLLLRWIHAAMVDVENNTYELALRYQDSVQALDNLLLAVEGLVEGRKKAFDLPTLRVLIRDVGTSDSQGNGWDQIESSVRILHKATSAFLANCTVVLTQIGASEVEKLITRNATGSREGEKEREAMTPEFKENLRLNRPLQQSDEDMGEHYAENLREIKAEFARSQGIIKRKESGFRLFGFLRGPAMTPEEVERENQRKMARNRCKVRSVSGVFRSLEHLARDIGHGKQYLSNTVSWIEAKVPNDKRRGMKAVKHRLHTLPILEAWKHMLEKEEKVIETDMKERGADMEQHVEKCTDEWLRLHPEEGIKKVWWRM